MNYSISNLHIEQLQSERERTLLQLARVRQILKSEIDPDTEDGASDLEEHEHAAALVPSLEQKLKTIDHALQRVQQGTYGLCERCGQPIDPARLEIVPEATFCMPCKTTVERAARAKTTTTRR